MAYATVADLTDRFGTVEIQQLTDRELPLVGAVVDDVAERAIDDAEALIDSHIGGRYAVPLSATVPAEITRVTCDIARYMLHDLAAPESVRAHYDDALRWLRGVADGKYPLMASDGSVLGSRSAPFAMSSVQVYPSDAVFGDSFAAAWQP